MLVIVNPYATTVSDRLKDLVVYALQGRYDVDALDTQRRGHATELCREAAAEGYDVVVAFGGDGTVNEAANGLAGSDTAADLPARRRHERLREDARHPGRDRRRHRAPAARRRRLAPAPGRPGERQRPALHVLGGRRPRRRRRAALSTPTRSARRATSSGTSPGRRDRDVLPGVPRAPAAGSRPTSAARSSPGSTSVVQNADPYTYFEDKAGPRRRGRRGSTTAGWPACVLHRATPIDVPTVAVRLLSRPPARHAPPRASRAGRGRRPRPASSRPTAARSRCRSTATRSATSPRPASA